MRFALLILAALPLAAASDLSGKWTLEGDVQGNPVNLSCSVQQKADAKLTGKCTLSNGDTVDLAGDVSEQKIKFSFTTPSGYTLEYSGTVQGDSMKGGIEVSGASGTFTGKRAAN